MSAEKYNRMLIERMHGDQRWENQPRHRMECDQGTLKMVGVATIRRIATARDQGTPFN